MKVPVFILSAAFGAVLALQGWMLLTLNQQGQDIASIKTALKFVEHQQTATANANKGTSNE